MRDFLAKHRLPDDYLDTANRYFSPLVSALITAKQRQSRTLYVGINGAQGSGKTTLADYLCVRLKAQGVSACALSIDDFYHTREQRQQLSQRIHPLLLTRGVPATHDVDLMHATLKALSGEALSDKTASEALLFEQQSSHSDITQQNDSTSQPNRVAVPRFDKARDDRLPLAQWDSYQIPVDIVILEGWCVAVPPQSTQALSAPINALEREHDRDGKWRTYVNDRLKTAYLPIWAMLDYVVMLKAPSFDVVYQWRLEQEEKLKQRLNEQRLNGQRLNAQDRQDKHSLNHTQGMMSAVQIREFIAYYERLTRHALETLPARADALFILNNNRQISTVEWRSFGDDASTHL